MAGAAALGRIQVGADLAYAADGWLPRNVKANFSIFGDDYNPTPSMVKSPNNPLPIHNLQVVIDEYQRMYPGVHVSVVTPHYSNDDRRTWEVTQLTGNVAPEILQTPAQAIIPDMGKGWWENLDPYLAQPNPYIPAGHPGHEHWIDEFYPEPTAVQRAPDGHLYALPYDFSADLVFYNKDMFAKAGVTPPKTYADFLTVLDKLHKAGNVAYGARTPTSPWFQLGEMAMRDYEKKIKPTGGGGSYTPRDVALAILNGVWGADKPEYSNYLELLKQQISYWKQDWPVYVGTIDPNVENEFQQGRVGVLNSGVYMISTLNGNNLLPFKWGAFFYPTLTRGRGPGQSPYADGKPAPSTGSADVMYAVTKTAREKGNLPVVIDFLRYISAPRQAGRIINELGQKLPMEIEVPVRKDLAAAAAPMYRSKGVGGMFFFQYTFDTETFQKVAALTTGYLLGRASLKATTAPLSICAIR